jgi:membrane protein implicated in regulation of membrane protease activity
MHILVIIIGLLLALFGGGCTLIWGGAILFSPNMARDLQNYGAALLFVGLLPLAGGIAMINWGVRRDREKRRQRSGKE